MVVYKDIVKSSGGMKLERAARIDLDKKYGIHNSVVAVSNILKELPRRVRDIDERSFLSEALKCYRAEAYRACIVMTWNLAYSHLLDWIIKDQGRLSTFNSNILKRYPKKINVEISNYSMFLDEFKDYEVIEICKSSGLINSNVAKILRDKIDRRNIAAHPSNVEIVQSQADDVVTDLVHNVVLSLP
jgi:hypothetical protein